MIDKNFEKKLVIAQSMIKIYEAAQSVYIFQLAYKKNIFSINAKSLKLNIKVVSIYHVHET